MDWQKLVRNPEKVHANLKVLPDKRCVTAKGCKIYIPSRFESHNLAEIGIQTYIVGLAAIVVEDMYYGVFSVNAMMQIEPTSWLKVTFGGDEYYEFTFEPGATVITTTELIRNDTLVYRIYNEIFSKGHVPWYLGYSEMGKIFDTARYHAGANIGENHEVIELLVSLIARDPEDRHQYYRNVVTDKKFLLAHPPAFISLRSVTYAATNTLNKLAGSYQHEGIVSALVTPTERVERIEELLRR